MLWLLLARGTPVHSAGVVSDCSNENDFDQKLVGGGTLTFNCNGTNDAATIVVSNFKTIVNSTTIDGGNRITLSGGNSTRIFSVTVGAAVTLRNITLTQGSAPGSGSAGDGGCVWNHWILNLDNVTVQRCFANNDGGGLFNNTGGTLNINNSIIISNTAQRDCGAICNYGNSLLVTGSAIVSNTARTRNVGGIGSAGGVVTLTNTLLMSNTTTSDGGALYNNGRMTLANVTLSGNTASNHGGGLYNSATGTAVISRSLIYGNSNLAVQIPGAAVAFTTSARFGLTNLCLKETIAGILALLFFSKPAWRSFKTRPSSAIP